MLPYKLVSPDFFEQCQAIIMPPQHTLGSTFAASQHMVPALPWQCRAAPGLFTLDLLMAARPRGGHVPPSRNKRPLCTPKVGIYIYGPRAFPSQAAALLILI